IKYILFILLFFFFFSSRRRHTRSKRDWSSDVCSSDLGEDVSFFFNLLNGLFGDNYLVLTTFTFIALALFPKYFESINGSQEIGTFLIYLFFVVIGIPASIPLIVQNEPLLLVFVAIIVCLN